MSGQLKVIQSCPSCEYQPKKRQITINIQQAFLEMKKAIKLLSGLKVKPDPTLSACKHKYLPDQQKMALKLISYSRDECISCEEHMCCACSEHHVRQHCHVNLQVYPQITQQKQILNEFNLGYLMKLELEGLKCICGTELHGNNPNHAICSACGMASCSIKCHSEWESMHNCTYHLNFFEKPQTINMRSILLQNIKNVQQANVKTWSLANKNPLNFIGCYACLGYKHVYLQRGFRNYGIPQDDILKNMSTVSLGLDFTTHIERVCSCSCQACEERKLHSVGNCEHDCHIHVDRNIYQYLANHEAYFECDCRCEFCSSGIVVNRHTKYDCMVHCYKSHYNMQQT